MILTLKRKFCYYFINSNVPILKLFESSIHFLSEQLTETLLVT
jgi:hypothetical protein